MPSVFMMSALKIADMYQYTTLRTFEKGLEKKRPQYQILDSFLLRTQQYKDTVSLIRSYSRADEKVSLTLLIHPLPYLKQRKINLPQARARQDVGRGQEKKVATRLLSRDSLLLLLPYHIYVRPLGCTHSENNLHV